MLHFEWKGGQKLMSQYESGWVGGILSYAGDGQPFCSTHTIN